MRGKRGFNPSGLLHHKKLRFVKRQLSLFGGGQPFDEKELIIDGFRNFRFRGGRIANQRLKGFLLLFRQGEILRLVFRTFRFRLGFRSRPPSHGFPFLFVRGGKDDEAGFAWGRRR